MAKTFTLNVNGVPSDVPVDDPQMPLLYALRNDLGLHAPRFGCGLAQCGACTVHVDGKPVRSCVYPVSQAAGKKVLTLEGLGSAAKPHPLQQAFIEEQAVQCGYCINGMIMQGKALLDHNKHPSDTEIRQALAKNLCRCGTHLRIVRAIKRAGEMMAAGDGRSDRIMGIADPGQDEARAREPVREPIRKSVRIGSSVS